jgi:WD40 repeat protein
VATTPDGKWIVSGSKDRGVQFWDPRTGQTEFMLQGHKNSGKYGTGSLEGWIILIAFVGLSSDICGDKSWKEAIVCDRIR